MSDFILDVGHVICCCSAVSAADRQRLWKLIQLLIHSVGNVSALFVESCCYSAVVRVGGFLETSSRSVLFSSCDCAGYRLALRYTGFGPSLAAKVLATRNVLWIPKVGLLWCLAFSDPLPTSFIFVSVQVIGWRCGILVSDPASQRRCWPQEMFYGFQR